MKKRKVYSGYARCCICQKHNQIVAVRQGCTHCNKRHFEYGVLHRNKFMTYARLKSQTEKGHIFIDGTHGLKITHKTFG